MPRIEVKVLGQGCATCGDLYKTVQYAVNQLGAHEEITVEYVENMSLLPQFRGVTAPAIIINGAVACQGRVPLAGEIVSILATELMK